MRGLEWSACVGRVAYKQDTGRGVGIFRNLGSWILVVGLGAVGSSRLFMHVTCVVCAAGVSSVMSIYEEIEFEDLEFDDEEQHFTYPCPCGDKFIITLVRIFIYDGYMWLGVHSPWHRFPPQKGIVLTRGFIGLHRPSCGMGRMWLPAQAAPCASGSSMTRWVVHVSVIQKLCLHHTEATVCAA